MNAGRGKKDKDRTFVKVKEIKFDENKCPHVSLQLLHDDGTTTLDVEMTFSKISKHGLKWHLEKLDFGVPRSMDSIPEIMQKLGNWMSRAAVVIEKMTESEANALVSLQELI